MSTPQRGIRPEAITDLVTRLFKVLRELEGRDLTEAVASIVSYDYEADEMEVDVDGPMLGGGLTVHINIGDEVYRHAIENPKPI